MPLRKIVSGGQTGVDRVALDAALASQFPCGGWCPVDRSAEDGVIPATYPLTPLPDGDLRERTRQNVIDSDGTLIVSDTRLTGGALAGGTQLTWRVAKEHETQVVSAVRARESRLTRRRCELRSRVSHEDAVSVASKLAQWVEQRSVKPWVVGSTPMLAPASEAGFRESAGCWPRIEVPQDVGYCIDLGPPAPEIPPPPRTFRISIGSGS